MAAADRINKGFEEENKNTSNTLLNNILSKVGNSEREGVPIENEGVEVEQEGVPIEREGVPVDAKVEVTQQTTEVKDGKTVNTARKWVEEPKKQAQINYGENGSTIEEIAQNLYGKDKAPEHYEDLAKALVNEKNFNKDAEFGKYRIDLEVGKANSANLGEYIGSNGLEKNQDVIKYIESFGGNTSGNIKQGIDRGVRSLESKKIFDEGMKSLDEKYRDKANDLYSDEFKGILNKLNDGVELTADETNKFGEAKGLFNEIENEIKNVGKSAGYNVDGDIFKELEAGNNNFNVFASNNSTYRSIRGAFNLPVVEDGKTKYNFVDPRNFEINSDGRVISKTVADNNSEPMKDFIADFSGKRDYITAESEFNKQYSGIDNYLEKGNKEFSAITGNSDAEKLYKLHQAGIDSNESTKILNAYASTDNTKIGDEIVNTINSAASVEANKYAISGENISNINSGSFKLENNNGKFSISQSSIDLLNDSEKEKYKNLIESKNVGQQDLKDIANAVNLHAEERAVEDIVNSNYMPDDMFRSNTSVKLNSNYHSLESPASIKYTTTAQEKIINPEYYNSNLDYSSGSFEFSTNSGTASTKLNHKYSNYVDSSVLTPKKGYSSDDMFKSNTSFELSTNSGTDSIKLNSEYSNYVDSIDLTPGKGYSPNDMFKSNTSIELNPEYSNYVDSINLTPGKEYSSDVSSEIDFQSFNESNKDVPLSSIEDKYSIEIAKEKAKKNIVDHNLQTSDIYTDYNKNLKMLEAQGKTPNKKLLSYDEISDIAKNKFDEFGKLKVDSEFGYSQEEILTRSGIDSKYAKEIAEAKDFNSLSPKARLGLYNSKNTLTEAQMNLGKISADDWEKIYKNNGHLFEGVDKTDSKGLSEKLFSFIKSRDGAGAGMKVHMTGADITDPKQAKAFVNNLLKDGEISFDKIDGLFSIENKNNIGSIGDLMAAAKTGNIDDYLKGKRRDSATNALVNKLEQIQKDFGDSKEFEGSDTISKITKRLKDPKNFTKEQIGQLDATLDNAKDFVDDIKKVGEGGATGKFGKGLSSIKGNSAVKIGAGIAAAMVIGGIASNASEERRRKREEMNQLIAIQSNNMRGGY